MRIWWISLFALLSCTTPSEQTTPIGPLPYQSAGTEQFFLAELPNWANGSLSAQCKRNFSVRYMDHEPLEKIHALDFVQRVELQTQFNRKYKERYTSNTLGLTPQEESVLFLETLEQVKAGLKDLRFPATTMTHLVWWDTLKDQPFAKKWLENLGDKGDPVVLISFCSDAATVENWTEEQELDAYGFFALGAESMGPQTPTGAYAAPAMPLTAWFVIERTTLWISGNFPAEFPTGYTVKNVEDPNVRQKR